MKSLGIIAALTLLLATPAHADIPIYVVDMQRVIAQSIIGKAAKSNIENELKKREMGLRIKHTEIEKERTDMQKQADLLSETALHERQELLVRKERDLQRAVHDIKEDLGRKNNTEIEKIVKEIDRVISGLAQENSYELVVEKDSRYLLYVKDEYDLTDRVIKELDKIKVEL